MGRKFLISGHFSSAIERVIPGHISINIFSRNQVDFSMKLD